MMNSFKANLFSQVFGSFGRATLPHTLMGGVALDLNFLTGVLDPRITFTRGSNAMLVDSTGKLTYAPSNLLVRSEQFDNAAWLKERASITANATVAPDETTTADKLVEDVSLNSHRTRTAAFITLPSGATVINSVHIKAAERTWVNLSEGGGTAANIYFNSATGAFGTVGAGVTGYGATDVGNGWWRVYYVCVLAGTASNPFISLANGDNGISYTGNGTSGIFIWGAQLEPVTYQTTPSPYVPTTASAYYGPRFDYDPVTLAPKGLLIEEQRTNLLVRSEQFDNAAWIKSQSTVTPNTTVAPDGTTSADTLTLNATSYPSVFATVVTTTSTTYTASVYAKAGTTNVLALEFRGVSSSPDVVFNLSNGTVTSGSGQITPAGNGWYRCSVTKAAVDTSEILIISSGLTPTIGQTLFLWGAQLEAGSFATSYIPTVASQVTRSADVATMTGTNFSSWYNQSEGSFVVDAISFGTTASGGRAFTAIGASTSEQVAIASDITRVRASNVDIGSFYSNVLLTGKRAVAYASGQQAAANGGSFLSSTNAGLPSGIATLYIGGNNATAYLNGHIRSIAYYSQRLPNAQLQALTI